MRRMHRFKIIVILVLSFVKKGDGTSINAIALGEKFGPPIIFPGLEAWEGREARIWSDNLPVLFFLLSTFPSV